MYHRSCTPFIDFSLGTMNKETAEFVESSCLDHTLSKTLMIRRINVKKNQKTDDSDMIQITMIPTPLNTSVPSRMEKSTVFSRITYKEEGEKEWKKSPLGVCAVKKSSDEGKELKNVWYDCVTSWKNLQSAGDDPHITNLDVQWAYCACEDDHDNCVKTAATTMKVFHISVAADNKNKKMQAIFTVCILPTPSTSSSSSSLLCASANGFPMKDWVNFTDKKILLPRTPFTTKNKNNKMTTTKKWNNDNEKVETAVLALENLVRSSTLMEKYVAKGGFLTPVVLNNSICPWAKGTVALFRNNKEEAIKQMDRVRTIMTDAKQMVDQFCKKKDQKERFDHAMKRLVDLIADKNQTASIVDIIAKKYMSQSCEN